MLKLQDIELSLLKPWEDSPRVNDEAVDAVATTITSFGFNMPILCDPEFTIISGHTRWKAVRKMGMTSVPVIVLRMTDVQRKAFALADNKTAELAKWDYVKVRKILDHLKCRKIDLPSLGYSQGELQALLAQAREFDWKNFDDGLKPNLARAYVLLRVKVPPAMKEHLKEAIERCADKNGIKKKDFAETAGAVFALLLGLPQ
jgi:ParB-like chromosome segregation protein Spo0J